jgi:predicted alpha/beta hydrolase family esterase
MRYLEIIYPQKVGGAIFVAGWLNLKNLEGPAEEAIAKPWIEIPIDFDKIKNATSNITAIFSENDPFVPLSDKDIFQEKLGAEIIVEKDRGHFTEDDCVMEIPDILERILR